MINIKNLVPNITKLYKKIPIYRLEYLKIKNGRYVASSSLNQLFLVINKIINEINGYTEESNINK